MINDNQQVQRRILLGSVAVMVLASVWIVDQSAQADSAAALRQVAQADQEAGQSNPAPAPTESPADESPKGFMQIVFSGGWPGFLIILLLLGLSLTAAYLVFEQLMTLRRSDIIPAGLGERFRELLATGKVAEAEALCREQPSLLSFVLLNGLSEIEGGWTAVEKALEDATAEQSARLYRKIEYLSVIGNIAPMVGLLGTVIGMIFAFHQVAISRGSAGAGDLAEGIYQALVTTVGGLIVAIPSLGAFAVFRNRVDQLVVEASYMSVHAFAPLKRRRSGSQKPPPAPPRGRPQKD
jgi:biopolymer transport protein ExbB